MQAAHIHPHSAELVFREEKGSESADLAAESIAAMACAYGCRVCCPRDGEACSCAHDIEPCELVTLRAAVQQIWPALDKQAACQAIKRGEVAVSRSAGAAPVVERGPGKRNISPSDTLCLRGGALRTLPPPLFVALHKPRGYTTTAKSTASSGTGSRSSS